MTQLLRGLRGRIARIGAGHVDDASTGNRVPAAWAPEARPVFVGGTGRSGTTVTARLLGFHGGCQTIRTEVKFVTAKGGLCDLVDGRVSYRAFADRILGPGFGRDPDRGLYSIIDRSQIRDALPQLREELRFDPQRAARWFVHRLLDPIATAGGARVWIEMTPSNAEAAPRLLAIFPDLRLVHTVRDGRDVACSVIGLDWGPNELHAALDWWARRLESAFVATERIPADRVLVVQMERLLVHDRDAEYRRLLDFIGLDDDPAMRRYFDRRMTQERAHTGRWREEVPADGLASFEAHYSMLVAGLRLGGHPYDPDGS